MNQENMTYHLEKKIQIDPEMVHIMNSEEH